jgi:hypothetical protein
MAAAVLNRYQCLDCLAKHFGKKGWCHAQCPNGNARIIGFRIAFSTSGSIRQSAPSKANVERFFAAAKTAGKNSASNMRWIEP